MTETALAPAEAEAFRAKCRAFLEAHTTSEGVSTLDDGRKFLAAAAEAGLAGITYPTEYGGAGLTAAHDKIWREERSAFPTMDSEFIISHGMCLPMLAEYGTEAQKKAFVADNISGATLWCQMFSEPGAGSDVASLQTRAVRDGDEWVINGQKVWTTLAHVADYGIVIARTDPDQPKHAGISMFILDMKAPGVEIRPIHQIDGGKHFNEVFFSDVRIPADWLIGDLNNGWRMATAMLMYERVAIGSVSAGKLRQPLYDTLRRHAERTGRISEPAIRDELMRIYSMETAKGLVALRTKAEQKAGKTPGPGGSLGKLFGSVISRRFRAIAAEISGPGSVAWADDDPHGGQLAKHLLNTFQDAIAGGTDEIQRNIIGDRVLGLPREPAVDRGVPFKELRVGTQD
ncbi:MAG: acyl-CoA dehydrogenase family protein [Actinomycetota bacterium]|nr:acyl-CoA dehydrogenase family protein [Actinomycetota bacterium]